MNTKAPLMFLDVDGVLSVLGSVSARRKSEYKRREVDLGRGVPKFHPTPRTKAFMHWAFRHFRVFWCTAWGAHANHIAKWAGLDPAPSIPYLASKSDWKLEGALQILSRYPYSRAVWIEDGFYEDTKRWAKASQGTLTLIETKTSVGVTPETCKMAAGAAVPARMTAEARRVHPEYDVKKPWWDMLVPVVD